MKVEVICPGVIHLKADTQYEISSAFMRIQEYYESANGLQGKYFTYEECMDAYAANHIKQQFTYTTDWAGFNVPGHIVDAFFEEFWGDLIEKEMELYDNIQEMRETPNGELRGKYYVIGTHECMEVSYYLYHEVCHALWYLHPKFKKESKRLVYKLPTTLHKMLCDKLIEYGYATSVLDDECNAYLATSDMRHIRYQLFEEHKGKTFPWTTICAIQTNFYQFFDELQETDD